MLFTDTLLARLSRDEVVAICAHELAHLEHFNARRLRRLNLVTCALIATAAAIAPVTRLAMPSSFAAASWLWIGAQVLVLVFLARDRQRHETESDLRAVTLTGNPDALVRALSDLYTFARIPRRLDAQAEQQSTHPSLARRIRAIRAAAAVAPASLGADATFTSADGIGIVTFGQDRLHWSEGEAVTHSFNYGHLNELRLHAHLSGPARLVIVERTGRRWEIPLDGSDVASAQAVLDVVDGRLPDPTVVPRIPVAAARVLAWVATAFGFGIGHIAMAVVALLALVQPAQALLAAAGLAVCTSAGIMLRDYGLPGAHPNSWLPLMLAAFGVSLLALARGTHRNDTSRLVTVAIASLGVAAAVATGAIAIGGLDLVRLHQATRSTPGAAVLLLAFGGALACSRVRAVRYASAAVALVGLAAAFAGSVAFLDRFGRDPFLVPAEPIAWRTVTGPALTEFSIPFVASEVRLSPDGRHVAVVSDEEDEEDTTTFHVGRAGGTLTPLAADDLVFVDNGDALLLESMKDGVVLRELALNAPHKAVWRQHVPDLHAAQLSFRASTSHWRLIGWDRQRGIVRAEGRVGSPGIEHTRWPDPRDDIGWTEGIAASEPRRSSSTSGTSWVCSRASLHRNEPGWSRLIAASPGCGAWALALARISVSRSSMPIALPRRSTMIGWCAARSTGRAGASSHWISRDA